MVGSLGLLQSRLRRARTGGLHFDTGKRNPKLAKCLENREIGHKNATVLRYQFEYRFLFQKCIFWGNERAHLGAQMLQTARSNLGQMLNGSRPGTEHEAE